MKTIVIGIVVILIILAGGWYFFSRGNTVAAGNTPAATQAADSASSTPPLPAPSLGTVVSIQNSTVTLQMQGSTTTEQVLIAPSTLVYDNGAPISSSALKAKQLVAVILYPPSVGQSNIAQTITVVSTQ